MTLLLGYCIIKGYFVLTNQKILHTLWYFGFSKNHYTMRKLLFVFPLFILGCDAENIADIGNQLTKDEKYQVGLSTVCSDNATKTWYCISRTEYDRLLQLERSCDVITITSSSDNNYAGIISSDYSFRKSENACSI